MKALQAQCTMAKKEFGKYEKNDLHNFCNEKFLDDLFYYNKCIALFVSKNNHYFIISDKEYFELNIKITFDTYLEKGIINKKQYNEYSSYRGGIWQLTKNNFEEFLNIEEVTIMCKSELQSLLFFDFDYKELQSRNTRLFRFMLEWL